MMDRKQAEALAQDLHETNFRLRSQLDKLAPHRSPLSIRAQPAQPEQMAGLLSELMRVGQWLRWLPQTPDPQLESELREYRGNVERLRTLLPLIHEALLEERARLEQERSRVGAAAEWADCSRQTL